MGFFSAGKSRYHYSAATLNRQGKRPSQQDSCGLLLPSDNKTLGGSRLFAAVADGMGGLQNGLEAAEMAVSYVINGCEKLKSGEKPENIPAKLVDIVLSVNDFVYSRFFGDSGTTLAAIAIVGDKLFWIAVGDSMILLCREGRIFRLNHEHSYHMLLRRNALLDGEPDKISPISGSDEHMLSAYIGAKELFDIDRNIYHYTLINGDKIILCTDGVSRSIDDSTMSVILKNPPDRVVDIIGGLIEHKANPRQDNYTAVVAEVLIEDQV